ncbi:MAG: hypothetical protein ACLRL6_14160 [Clostridium sp.]
MLQAQLFSHYHQIGMILLNMCNLAKRNNRMDMLRSYLQLMEGLSHLFQLLSRQCPSCISTVRHCMMKQPLFAM